MDFKQKVHWDTHRFVFDVRAEVAWFSGNKQAVAQDSIDRSSWVVFWVNLSGLIDEIPYAFTVFKKNETFRDCSPWQVRNTKWIQVMRGTS